MNKLMLSSRRLIRSCEHLFVTMDNKKTVTASVTVDDKKYKLAGSVAMY